MSSNYDVRILALKRWNLPQTKSLLSIREADLHMNKNIMYDRFVSFQSHHFIDIIPTHLDQENVNIPNAYQCLCDYRTSQRAVQDIHTVQSLTLIGEKDGFWDEASDMLNITLIQLSNHDKRDIHKMKDRISKVMKIHEKKCGSIPRWTVYYALDFCDMVLFTKNVDIAACHDILWELTLVRDDTSVCIRDTFTMNSIRHEFLADAFHQIDAGAAPIWNERTAISIQLSIQDYQKWEILKNKLTELSIGYKAYRSSGRYDLNVVTEKLFGTDILQILRELDRLCQSQNEDYCKDTAFGGYEVQFLVEHKDYMPGSTNIVRQQRQFETEALGVMAQLCERYCAAFEESADYIHETRASLEALLKNGFSEEFVLSVFQSFVVFMNNSLELGQEIADAYHEALKEINVNYFTTLNTLALCTMHSERQFIQAPSFNATYFEVPPKLLAFYSAIMNDIAETLREKEAIYRFVIAPDYGRDIYVEPLRITQQGNTKENLAVVHLGEQYFYNPEIAIALFCHECAHYLSDRKRKERAEAIFHSTAIAALVFSPVFRIVNNCDDPEISSFILNKIADVLQNIYMNRYKNDSAHFENNQLYYRDNILQFLKNYQYGMTIVQDEDVLLRDELCELLANSEVYDNRAVCIWAENLGTKMNFYIETEEMSKEQRIQMCQLLAADAVLRLKEMEDTSIAAFRKFCEDMFSAYSEAYADMRMAEMLGDMLDLDRYEYLLEDISVDERTSRSIRHDAVCRILGYNKAAQWCNSNDLLSQALQLIVNDVTYYLTLCHKKPCTSEIIPEIVCLFRGEDMYAQFAMIHAEITKYRRKMVQYCKASRAYIENLEDRDGVYVY